MTEATTRVYELVYPADWPRYGGLPAYVAVGTGAEPWGPLWELRDVSGSRLAAWFRELAASGLRPQESNRWLPRATMTHRGAVLLARMRLRQIAAWCGDWPPWLLNDRPGRPARPSHSLRPVARVFPGGRVVRFSSTRAAARAMGMTRPGLAWFLRTGHRDSAGACWVELAPATPCNDGPAL